MALRALKCPNCQGTISNFDETMKKGICPYCNSIIVNVPELQQQYLKVKGIVQIDRSNMVARYREMAFDAYNATNYPEAVSYFNSVLELTPNDPDAIMYKGLAIARQSSLAYMRLKELLSAAEKATTLILSAAMSKGDKVKLLNNYMVDTQNLISDIHNASVKHFNEFINTSIKPQVCREYWDRCEQISIAAEFTLSMLPTEMITAGSQSEKNKETGINNIILYCNEMLKTFSYQPTSSDPIQKIVASNEIRKYATSKIGMCEQERAKLPSHVQEQKIAGDYWATHKSEQEALLKFTNSAQEHFNKLGIVRTVFFIAAGLSFFIGCCFVFSENFSNYTDGGTAALLIFIVPLVTIISGIIVQTRRSKRYQHDARLALQTQKFPDKYQEAIELMVSEYGAQIDTKKQTF